MGVRMTSRIPAMIAEVEGKASLVVHKTTLDVEANAKTNIETVGAIDTGNMLNSVASTFDGPLHGRVTAGADYSGYVENGTHKMAPRPYMLPAAETVRPSFIAAMAQIIK